MLNERATVPMTPAQGGPRTSRRPLRPLLRWTIRPPLRPRHLRVRPLATRMMREPKMRPFGFRAPRSFPLPAPVASAACGRRDKRRATADPGSGAKSGRYDDGTSGDLPVPVVTGERVVPFAHGNKRKAQRPSRSCKKPALFRGELGETLLITPSGSRRAKKLLMIGQAIRRIFRLKGCNSWATFYMLRPAASGLAAVLCSQQFSTEGLQVYDQKSRRTADLRISARRRD
jgi:hypothetical protein